MRVIPPIWQLATQATAIPANLSRTWWQAVEGSRWSEVVQWRQALLLLQTFGDPTSLPTIVWTPQRCLQILDRLWQEKRLCQADRVLLQEHILHHVGPTGQWR
jgi:hypothetical protein